MDNLEKYLGFDYVVRKNGDVAINRYGKFVVILRGKKANEFIIKMDDENFSEKQQIMARVTGNYKKGNERNSKNHSKRK